jgi:hypothetical protein
MRITEFNDLFDGEIHIGIEQETIHLKAGDEHGDPVELTSSMAVELAELLLKLAAKIND